MNQLVELKSIKKKYGKKTILYDMSLRLEEKEVIAVLGGNGSGKSTFLRMAAGVERPDSGQVVYTDKNIRIGYVPERFPNYLRFTPNEYLHYTGRIGDVSEAELKQRISSLLHRFQLDKWSDRRISTLSKGNIQKVGIIQAILPQPELLVLDEPLSGLDFSAQQELLLILDELKEQGTAILLTYHEAPIFEEVVDQTYYIKDGQLTEEKLVEKDAVKVIEVKGLTDIDVQEWNELINKERRENSLLLYVNSENSDQLLSRILELQGSIEYVGNIDYKME
ncbi:ABC transporter ATP-binding protein [Oceanobacillus oncorhynchi subsp. incaldanensis]|uniref:ABC transporter ATP-binding protein n=1 Tax=Oceanobacillus aidingensis TaxID=645964 RepID=A0ABV9JZS1_9BACI|nr:ABC transporter ATP-binding protein [Oceanobacillus oncorhynchi]MDM8098552.1 ABC transporter ATP-binding protein [Oceanobacillus oncorhynchi]GIO19199.1 ABC transporter ATP-binding protein [Oceanobacillus oncorhynchi subsp. incaldanensis]